MRDYVCAFIRRGVDSLRYKRPAGRPPKLTKTQRRELADLITAGPEAADELLDELGFSFQKARSVSDHLDGAARQHWLTETWPEIRQVAQAKQAMILFGDEANFAQWGAP